MKTKTTARPKPRLTKKQLIEKLNRRLEKAEEENRQLTGIQMVPPREPEPPLFGAQL